MPIRSINSLWKKYSIHALFIFFFLSIIIGYISNRNSVGTWDNYYYYSKSMFKSSKTPYRSSPLVTTPVKTPKDSKLEIACRSALQRMFKRPFDKIRPDWLRNVVTGGKWNLEIDCYDEELKIAVEAQGRQHYEFIPYFHRTYETFLNQKYRDEIKRMKCKEQGVILIEVPYTTKDEDVENYLRSECKRLNIKVPY